ncbi:MAG TPA: hypothetical protein VEF04_03150 [Blastocatellia bacterium]|nr:hypothetical protein [Blastocatellia bacterium]
MHPLFRNPLFLLLRRFWWLLVVITALICAFGGEKGLEVAGYFLLSILAFLTGIIAAALAHGYWKISQTRWRHGNNRHCFLCPHCLHFGGFRYACNSCKNEVEAFAAATVGSYVNSCPNCYAPLFERNANEQHNVSAYCENCFGLSPLEAYHERSVSIIVTIFASDFLALRDASQAQSQIAKDGTEFFCLDDGKELKYFLNCSEAQTIEELDRTHVLQKVISVWIDTANLEPLHFARAMDAFIRKLGTDSPIKERVNILVKQNSPDAFIKTRLEAQFTGIKYGVELKEILIGKDVLITLKESQHRHATLAASANDTTTPIKQNISEQFVSSHQPQSNQD